MQVDLLHNDTAALAVPILGLLVLLYLVWYSRHFEALTSIVFDRETSTRRAP